MHVKQKCEGIHWMSVDNFKVVVSCRVARSDFSFRVLIEFFSSLQYSKFHTVVLYPETKKNFFIVECRVSIEFLVSPIRYNSYIVAKILFSMLFNYRSKIASKNNSK